MTCEELRQLVTLLCKFLCDEMSVPAVKSTEEVQDVIADYLGELTKKAGL